MYNALSLNLGCVLFTGTIFFLAFSLGRSALGALRIESGTLLLPVATALGLGILSDLVLLLGITGRLTPLWIRGMIGMLLLAFAGSFKSNLSAIGGELKALFSQEPPRGFKFFVSIFIALFIFNSFIPDQFYDVLVYHLAVPQAYLTHGKILPIPYNAHSAFPETAEMLFTLGMGLVHRDNIPLLLQLGFCILIISTLIRLGEPSGKIAAILWASTPLVIENARFAKNDTLFCLWILMTFAVLWNSKEGSSSRPMALAGIFAGLAMGTKYTGIPFALGFSWFAFQWPKTAGSKEKIKNLMIYWAASLLAFSPWLIKNWACFHNPLYPFFQELFGWVNMTSANWKVFKSEQSQHWLSAWRFQDLFKTFWKNTFEGFKYPSMNFIGPVWLAFLPLALIRRSKSPLLRTLIPMILLTLAFSSFQTTLARYLILPVLPFFALAISQSLEGTDSSFKPPLITFLLCFGVALNFLGWLPLLERLSYCRTALWGLAFEKTVKLYPEGYLEAAKFVNRHLSQNARILFLGETRSHLFERPVIAPSVHNEHLFAQVLEASKNSQELYSNLRLKGVTHLLYNGMELDRLKGYPMFHWQAKDRRILQTFWAGRLHPIYANPAVTLYELTDQPEHEKNPSPLPGALDALLH